MNELKKGRQGRIGDCKYLFMSTENISILTT
jgi:hypothetical protein